MTTFERIFHAVLFEVILIALSIGIASLLTQHDSHTLSGVIVLMSLIAMVWNYIFNLVFDRIFTGERLARGFGLRLFHSITFEGGLLFFTLPLIVFMLNISWLEAFLMDVGMTLGVLVYTIIFNWLYDILRDKWQRKAEKENQRSNF